jgi:hypothetical protein
MLKLSRRFVASFALFAVPLSFFPGDAAQAQRVRPSNPPVVAAPTGTSVQLRVLAIDLPGNSSALSAAVLVNG